MRRFRRAAGLTQEELAERATLSARAISDLERGLKRHPQAATLRLLAEALALNPPDRAALDAAARGHHAPASARLLTAPVDNLPAPVTPLVGRDRAVAALCALLRQPDVRLVTLLGVGGVGKTRLAIAAAADLRGMYPDGCCFVSLDSVTDPARLTGAIAAALGVHEQGGRSLVETLHAWLHDRTVLLILDSFEQLIASVTQVAALLAAAPRLDVLVTSREALHLRGEHEVVVPPLSLPAPTAALPVFARAPAVRVFCQYAGAARADFRLTTENAAAVGAICTRLDGIPLALELVAARVKLFTPAALLARLEMGLPEPAAHTRDGPARQRTMHDTIAWSYDLLPAEEQVLFRRLAVFVSGCTLAMVAAVCSDVNTDEAAALVGLGSLVDKSLVRVQPDAHGTPRFGMFTAVWEFAGEQLAVSGEAMTVHARHAAAFAAMAEEVEAAFLGSDQASGLDRLEADHDNLRAALRVLAERRDVAQGLRAVFGMHRLWLARGYLSEGSTWLATFLDLADAAGASVPPMDVYMARFASGRLALYRGDTDAARDAFTRMLAEARAAGDGENTAAALTQLGHIARYEDDYETAHARYIEALALREARNDPHAIALTLPALGWIAVARGDTATARSLLLRALTLYRDAGDRVRSVTSLRLLGLAAMRDGEMTEARRWLIESLTTSADLHAWGEIAADLEGFAMLAAQEGQRERAPRLAGAAAALRTAIQTPRFTVYTVWLDDALAPVRAALTPAAFATAWEAGAALPLDDAMTLALTSPVAPSASQRGHAQ